MASKAESLEKAEHWRGVLARQAASGLSAAEFCRRDGISNCQFFYWKKRLSRPPGSRAPQVPAPAFQEVRLADGFGQTAELVFPNGLVLRFPPDVAAEHLARLVEAIGGARC